MTGERPVEPWGIDRLDDLVALAHLALPDEDLGADDLAWCCFDDPPRDRAQGRVGPSWTLGAEGPDGPIGAVSVSLRHHDDLTSAHVQLLVVAPAFRRRGVARMLLAAAAARAVEAGAAALHLGGAAPFYLFTGVDSRWTAALCLAEALGFTTTGVELDLVAATSGVAAPGGSSARVEVLDAAAMPAAEAFLVAHHRHWLAEVRRGVARGVVVAAFDGTAVVGVAAHSVNRAGVVGPVAVHPDRRGAGVGRLLVAEVLADLRARRHDRAEIAWTSTVRFYAIACDARVLRSSLSCTKWLREER